MLICLQHDAVAAALPEVLVLSAAIAVARKPQSGSGTVPEAATYRLDICKVHIHVSCGGDDVRDATNTLQRAAEQWRAVQSSAEQCRAVQSSTQVIACHQDVTNAHVIG
jgi:hypothetical protein